MTRHVRLPFLLFLHQSFCKASPLRRAPASSVLQDMSKTVVTKTVVTTITTQTQETKTVVTKEKPAEDPEVSRFENDSNVRQSMLPVSEGSMSVAEVMASLRRSIPREREEVETIQFPSSPSAYFRKETHGDPGVIEDNVADQSQPEQSQREPETSLVDLREKHNVKEAQKAQHIGKSNAEASSQSKQDRVVESGGTFVEKVDRQNQNQNLGDAKTSRWQSLLGTSAGVQSEMLPAACRLLFFLIGLVIVVLAACGCASAALLA